jgi:pimeloyl-ACP methyl ester carboxylesterase
MDGTGQLLRSQTRGLERAFDVRCLAIPADDLTGWEDLAAAVTNLVKTELQERPSRTVYLCGESFGGCLALKVALRSPELFSRLVLVNPATSFNQRPWLRWGAQMNRWLPDSLFGASTLALLPFLCSLGRTAPEARRALLDAMRSVPPETANWRVSLVSEFDVDEAQLQRLHQPTLLIAGAADRLLPSTEEAERLANCLPEVKIALLPQSGHACLLEAEVSLFELMKEQDFLDASVPNQELDSVSLPATK